MTDQIFDPDTYVDAAASVLGMLLDPAHRPGILQNFERIAQMAAVVMEFQLPDEAEPAPVFHP